MADKESKYPENENGPFYVDDSCIACGLCPNEAPNNFTMSDDESHAYVKRQPADDSEKDECQDALNACPVDAIGDDGLVKAESK